MYKSTETHHRKPFILTWGKFSEKTYIPEFLYSNINLTGDSFEKTIKVFRLKSYNLKELGGAKDKIVSPPKNK